jgi:hypothetical protein
MNFYKQVIIPLINHPLNSKNKFYSILNFVFWQFKLRIVYPSELIVSFTNRSKFIVQKGQSGLTGNLYCGLHDFEDMSFILHFLII